MRRIATGSGLALMIGTLATAAAAQADRGYYDHSHMWGEGWGMLFMGPVMMILLLGVLVAAAVVLVRWLGDSSGKSQGGSRRPREILDERFARGEIDAEEYRTRKAELER